MIRMYLSEAIQPMRLAGPVHARDGRVLLGAGTALTETYIERLKSFGVFRVWIRDERLRDITPLDLYSEETRARISTRLSELFVELQSDKAALRKTFAGAIFDRLISEALDDRHEPIPAPENAPMEDPLVAHSVKVCLLATALGVHLSYGRSQLVNLSAGALLHDVGRALPHGSRGVVGETLEEDPLHHTHEGFEAILRARNLSATMGVVCLQHHERPDGFGSPKKLKGDAIHPFSRLVAIVDSYDKCVSGPEAILPHQAIETLREGAGTRFDAEMIEQFRARVAIYPPGTPLCLSNGEQAVVTAVTIGSTDRPHARVLSDSGTRELDLSKEKTIAIEAIGWRVPVVDYADAA